MKEVTIICPIYNEERFIETCIQSVLAQDFPIDKWELLLVDGDSTDKTRELISPFLKQYPNIRLLDNVRRTAPCAMNIGIREAKGSYICRIDAHSSFPTHYISTLLRYLNELPDASNVGGVCETIPANDSLKAQAIAIACSNPIGVGNSMFRTATIQQPTEADTVPFGFWRKSLFEEMGPFDEELTRNQDDEFNARTIQHGGHIYLVPGIRIRYYARDTMAKIWRMFYQYGLFKPLVNKKINHPATIRQFVPLLFVIGLIVGLPLACLFPTVRLIYLICIALYVGLMGFEGLKYKNAYLPPTFATIHVSYGLGYLHGIINVICKKPFNVETNR